jgi:hypothetical protein
LLSARLNMLSMRSVMMKPPTTLVMAHTTAMKPRIVATLPYCPPASTMLPTSEMPLIALVAAMSGVCSSGGTLRDDEEADEAGENEDVELNDLRGSHGSSPKEAGCVGRVSARLRGAS